MTKGVKPMKKRLQNYLNHHALFKAEEIDKIHTLFEHRQLNKNEFFVR